MEHQARQIVQTLRSAGHEAYWVGGCVRDRLLGRPMKDIDIATDARPEQIARLFGNVRLVGAAFGVSLVILPEGTFEVATFRRDGRYVDYRRPESVEFGTAEQDARRRDFTVNALFYDPEADRVIDHVGGREDLARRLIRTVGEPRARFAEDALRLLRAVRFAAHLGFEIDPATWQAIRDAAPTIQHVSAERIRDELTAMMTGDHPARAFQLLDACGLLGIVLPEISAMKGVEQGRDAHPEGDVFVHTMLCLENLRERTPVTCWAMLLHDVGKPDTFERRDGRITFYGHEQLGAEIAERVLRRMRFSSEQVHRITTIVGRHMRFIHAREWNRSTMRRFLSSDTIREDLAVHRSDCLSSHGSLANWEFVSAQLEEFEQAHEPVLPPPLLTGDDLIEMGYQPGPVFREILTAVQEQQLEGILTTSVAARQYVLEKFGRRPADPANSGSSIG